MPLWIEKFFPSFLQSSIDMSPNNEPLVSVIIITYNSSKYILETLESIRNQTYSTIELVITDDHSSDGTVELCRQWLQEHGDTFQSTQLLTSPINTGVAPNCQRGFKACTGTWIKPIAGDDALKSHAISTFVRFVEQSTCLVCLSDVETIDEESTPFDAKLGDVYDCYLDLLEMPLQAQMKQIARALFTPAPPLFVAKSVLDETGGWDVAFPFADEWPLFFKIIQHGYRIHPLRQKLVLYRVHDSLCRGQANGLINKRVFDSMRLFARKVIIPYHLKRGHLLFAWDLLLSYFVVNKQYTHSTNPYKILTYLSPLAVYKKSNKLTVFLCFFIRNLRSFLSKKSAR